MAQSEKQKIEPATKKEAEKLLTDVFGKEIFVGSEYIKERNSGASKLGTLKNSAWYLYYDGIFITFQSDIPHHHAREVAEDIRRYFRNSSEYEKKKNKLPKLEELINDGLTIRIEPLRAFAAAGVSLASRSFNPMVWAMNLALEHEKDWRSFEQYCLNQASNLILGRADDSNGRRPYFRYETRSWENPIRHQLYLMLDLPIGLKRHPQMGKDVELWQLSWKAPDIFNPRARELGIDHLFKYEFFHEGTHAPRDEDRIIMNAYSPEGLAVKLAELTKPEILEKVKIFFREVIREMPASLAVHLYPKEYYQELRKRVSDPKKVSGKKIDCDRFFNARKRAGEQLLMERPDINAWAELASTFLDREKTVGDVISVLRNPPSGKEDTCERIKAYILKRLPLLAAEFEQPTAPPKPQVSGPADAPQVK